MSFLLLNASLDFTSFFHFNIESVKVAISGFHTTVNTIAYNIAENLIDKQGN